MSQRQTLSHRLLVDRSCFLLFVFCNDAPHRLQKTERYKPHAERRVIQTTWVKQVTTGFTIYSGKLSRISTLRSFFHQQKRRVSQEFCNSVQLKNQKHLISFADKPELLEFLCCRWWEQMNFPQQYTQFQKLTVSSRRNSAVPNAGVRCNDTKQ